MPIGMEVGLYAGEIVLGLDGDPVPAPGGMGQSSAPLFGPCLCGQTTAHLSNC